MATRKRGQRSTPAERERKRRWMAAYREEERAKGAAVPPMPLAGDRPKCRRPGSKPRFCKTPGCGTKLNSYSQSRELCFPCLRKRGDYPW